MDAVTGEVDLAAFPAEPLTQIDIDFEIQQAIVDKSLTDAATGVVDVVTGLVECETDAVVI